MAIRTLANAIAPLALTLAAVASLPAAARAATGLPLGATAPGFTKNELSGGTVSLSDYSGKVVLLFLLGYN